MLFCAGKGTRMKALTQRIPKPMIRVNNMPLVDHALDAMSGINRRFANIHHLPDAIEKHLSEAGVTTIHETDLLETGGGLKRALPIISRNTIFTMNTDAVWVGPKPAKFLSAHWNPDIMDGLMLLISKDKAAGHKGRGDFIVNPAGQLERGFGDVFSGLQIIKSKYVEQVSETHFSLNVVWEQLLERKTLFGTVYPGSWCDVGYPEAIDIAEKLVRVSADVH
jgi:MurNAc alpha-1-phosphate uridylyltransferase